MVFDARSVTARRCASRSKRIAAPPLALGLNDLVQRGSAVRRPSSTRNPVTVLLDLLSTYKTRFVAARLTGVLPFDGYVPIGESDVWRTANAATLLLAALTANRYRWSG